jgi:hemerythrin
MPLITWDSTFSVGVKEMDTQHQAALNILNRLHDAMRSGKASQELEGILGEMANYAQFHFSSEEKILANAGYPGLSGQRMEHNKFTQKVSTYQADLRAGKMALSVEVIDFLKKWWVDHIQGIDYKYAAFLKEKGIE